MFGLWNRKCNPEKLGTDTNLIIYLRFEVYETK